jgi:hypothetical protein
VTSRPPSPPLLALSLARRSCAFALVLLAVAGFRHHLVWGEGSPLGFRLRPWLDAGETACLVGFAWFGTRGWLRAIAAVRERTPGPGALLRATVPLLLLAILVPPFLSADVADYVMRGRVLALHGGNPYVHVATDFPNDPFLAFGDAGWKQFPLPYGPLVADLQGACAWLADRLGAPLPLRAQFVLAVVLLKAVFAAALLASAVLARGIGERLRPGGGDAAFVMIAWCPLLLNEALASAHNEALLLLTILAAVHGAIAGRFGLAAFAVGLGVLTKIVPVLIAPLLLVWALRSGRLRAFAAGALAAGGVAAMEAWRFFGDPGALDFLRRQSEVTSVSLAWTAASLLGIETATAVAAGRVVVVAVVAWAALRLWRRPSGDELLGGAAAAFAAMAFFGVAGFGLWYHVWWAPLALLAGPGFLARFAVAVSWLSPLGYVWWTAARRLDDPHQVTALVLGVLLPAVWAQRARRALVVPTG